MTPVSIKLLELMTIRNAVRSANGACWVSVRRPALRRYPTISITISTRSSRPRTR